MEMTVTVEEVGAGHLLTDCYSIHTHTRALHIQIRLTGYHYPDLKTQQRHVAVCLRLCQTPPLPALLDALPPHFSFICCSCSCCCCCSVVLGAADNKKN
jgi:hypothetical protein